MINRRYLISVIFLFLGLFILEAILRTQGIDPNKKYRENNRDRLKEYAKWYYHNVQKPKNELLRKQNPQ